MNKILISSVSLALASLSLSAHAANYDCSKAGNANKTVCKGTTAATKVVTPPKTRPLTPLKAATASPAPAAAVTVQKPKAPALAPRPFTPAPRPVAAAARPGTPTTAWTTKTGKVLHYDCSKAGNQNKQACKR